MICMVRPGEGGIYDNAKVFMVGRYRDRVTGIIGKVEDGHWICGRGKKEELGCKNKRWQVEVRLQRYR